MTSIITPIHALSQNMYYPTTTPLTQRVLGRKHKENINHLNFEHSNPMPFCSSFQLKPFFYIMLPSRRTDLSGHTLYFNCYKLQITMII